MSVVCKFSYHLRVYTGIGAVSKYWTSIGVLCSLVIVTSCLSKPFSI